MRTWLSRTGILIVLIGLATAAWAQPPAPIRLKGRTFVPTANVDRGRGAPDRSAAMRAAGAPGRQHLIIQFDAEVTKGDLAALRKAGAVPLRYVPDHALAVSAPVGFDPALVPGARWAGTLAAADRLSADTAAEILRQQPRFPLTIVEFHPDLTAADVSEHLARAGTAAIPVSGRPAHVALIATDAAAIRRLADMDGVAWMYPATVDALSPSALMCGGLASAQGLVAEFATLGDGWDGPGRGSARLGYFFQRLTPDVSSWVAREEIRRALQEWSRYIDVEFRQEDSAFERLSMTVLWGSTDHGDGYPFAPEVLAHAFYQAPVVPEPLAGDVHFNDAFQWGARDGARYDIFTVMLHESGHSLGLTHSSDPDAVMYPIYRGMVDGLSPSDIAAARALYASADGPLPDGWTDDAIGAGIMGQAVESDGVITIESTGRDVWGTADELRFVSTPLEGDGDIVARLDSLAAVHRWTKAGVMVRSSASAGAAQAFMLVSGEKGIAFQRRRVDGGVSVSTDAVPGTAPRWVWLSRRGNRFDAYSAVDGGSWKLIGSDTIAMPSKVLAGLALTSHDAGAVATAVFSSVAVTRPPAWKNADIGAVGRAGSLSVSGPQIRVSGAGADVWGTADAFHYAWQPLSGDGEIIARVASIQFTDKWTKAGVMIRASADADAAHAFMLVSSAKGYAFQRRTTEGGLSSHTSGGSGTAPQWVKLQRRGDVFTAYRSSDGEQWTLVGSQTISMGHTVLAGLAVSSHTTSATCLAVFDNVSVR